MSTALKMATAKCIVFCWILLLIANCLKADASNALENAGKVGETSRLNVKGADPLTTRIKNDSRNPLDTTQTVKTEISYPNETTGEPLGIDGNETTNKNNTTSALSTEKLKTNDKEPTVTAVNTEDGIITKDNLTSNETKSTESAGVTETTNATTKLPIETTTSDLKTNETTETVPIEVHTTDNITNTVTTVKDDATSVDTTVITENPSPVTEGENATSHLNITSSFIDQETTILTGNETETPTSVNNITVNETVTDETSMDVNATTEIPSSTEPSTTVTKDETGMDVNATTEIPSTEPSTTVTDGSTIGPSEETETATLPTVETTNELITTSPKEDTVPTEIVTDNTTNKTIEVTTQSHKSTTLSDKDATEIRKEAARTATIVSVIVCLVAMSLLVIVFAIWYRRLKKRYRGRQRLINLDDEDEGFADFNVHYYKDVSM